MRIAPQGHSRRWDTLSADNDQANRTTELVHLVLADVLESEGYEGITNLLKKEPAMQKA